MGYYVMGTHDVATHHWSSFLQSSVKDIWLSKSPLAVLRAAVLACSRALY